METKTAPIPPVGGLRGGRILFWNQNYFRDSST